MTWDFAEQLSRWGPERSNQCVPSLDESREYCRQVAVEHYENFPVVTRFLPRQLHQHFYNVYAYCRWADDLGDEVSGADRSRQLLSWWRDQLRSVYQAEASTQPVFIALSERESRN